MQFLSVLGFPERIEFQQGCCPIDIWKFMLQYRDLGQIVDDNVRTGRVSCQEIPVKFFRRIEIPPFPDKGTSP